MYVPPYEAVLRALKTSNAAIESSKKVTIPSSMFKLLLQIALGTSDFDEESYIRANPDVGDAVNNGKIKSAYLHYIGFGYFEGRAGGMPEVDERWYLRKYPDVANAVKNHTIESATEHFCTTGAGEGRSPNPEQETYAMKWKEAIQSN